MPAASRVGAEVGAVGARGSRRSLRCRRRGRGPRRRSRSRPACRRRRRDGRDHADDVVAVEVGGAVEGAGRGFAGLEPEGGGVAADRAEAVRMQGAQVVGAEAAHRDAADRDPAGIGPEARLHRRDHLAASRSVPSRRRCGRASSCGRRRRGRRRPGPAAHLRQALEDGLVADEGLLGAAAPVQEDEQGRSPAGAVLPAPPR